MGQKYIWISSHALFINEAWRFLWFAHAYLQKEKISSSRFRTGAVGWLTGGQFCIVLVASWAGQTFRTYALTRFVGTVVEKASVQTFRRVRAGLCTAVRLVNRHQIVKIQEIVRSEQEFQIAILRGHCDLAGGGESLESETNRLIKYPRSTVGKKINFCWATSFGLFHEFDSRNHAEVGSW